MGDEYGLVFDFNIDGHQLDDLTPQQIFVLGFEMAQIWHALSEPGDALRVEMMIRPGNVYRARAACKKLGWAMRSRAMVDGWVEIVAHRESAE